MGDEGKQVVFEFPAVLTLFKDGSVRRGQHMSTPASLEPGQDGVASKDLSLNPDLGLWARLSLPPPPSPADKLPLVLFFHGGGLVIGSPAETHSLCAQLSKQSGSICVSASYRLAPEHRLPTAYDDGFVVLQWLHSQALLQAEGNNALMEPWLAQADFSKCFLAGESAGGNLAHHLAMRVMNHQPLSSSHLCIGGLILIHPGFKCGARLEDEEGYPPEMVMYRRLADCFVDLSLPLGAERHHPYFNPLLGFSSMPNFVLPKTLVALADQDRLRVYGLEYIQALKNAGCWVDLFMSQGVGHVFYYQLPHSEQTQTFLQRITRFITEEC